MATRRHSARGRDGRYEEGYRCDQCGKTCGDAQNGDYCTDDEVCGSSDGPGFFLCNRVRCVQKREGKTPRQRYELLYLCPAEPSRRGLWRESILEHLKRTEKA